MIHYDLSSVHETINVSWSVTIADHGTITFVFYWRMHVYNNNIAWDQEWHSHIEKFILFHNVFSPKYQFYTPMINFIVLTQENTNWPNLYPPTPKMVIISETSDPPPPPPSTYPIDTNIPSTNSHVIQTMSVVKVLMMVYYTLITAFLCLGRHLALHTEWMCFRH